MIPPPEAIPILAALAPAFTQPTYHRFLTLLLAAILTTGRRTVANLLRTLGGLARGHRTDSQRVLSRASWPALDLGCILAGFLLRHPVPDGTIVLVGDDTVDGHTGKKVHGKARHRDPVRSTHSPPSGGTVTSGSSWPSWSNSPSLRGPGRCRCWSICTTAPRTFDGGSGLIAPRPN